MKNSQNRLTQLKYQLKEKKNSGEKFAIWKLTMEQKAFLQELGYEVIPVLYVIETKRIAVTSSSNGLLKYINRASARGQKRIFRKLKATELKTLEELNIACTPCKYKINLS